MVLYDLGAASLQARMAAAGIPVLRRRQLAGAAAGWGGCRRAFPLSTNHHPTSSPLPCCAQAALVTYSSYKGPKGAPVSQLEVRDVVWRDNLGGEHLELGAAPPGVGRGKQAGLGSWRGVVRARRASPRTAVLQPTPRRPALPSTAPPVLLEHFASEFNALLGGGQDVRSSPRAMAKLRKQARPAGCCGGCAGCCRAHGWGA